MTMKQRFLYIDVLRGIAILIVIYSHILLFCVGYSETSALTNLLRLYFLNAFFFLSGFMAYKAPIFNLSQIIRNLWKKITVLLIATFITGGLYCAYINGNPYSFLADGAKGGYWFTIALFIMMIIYTIEDFFIKKLKNRYLQSGIILLVAGFIYWWHKTGMASTAWANYLSLGGTSYYFLMFTSGVLCKKHLESFHRYLDIPLVKTSIFLIAMLGAFVGYIPLLITNITVVLSTYFIIKDILNNYPETNDLQRLPPIKKTIFQTLALIGKNTIEIYFLHYFLLFKMPQNVVTFTHNMYKDSIIANHCSGIVEFGIYGSISIAIAFVCVGIHKIITHVPYLSRLMFGR